MKIGIASLVISAIALAVALTSMPSASSKTSRAPAPDNRLARIADLEAKIESLSQEVRTLEMNRIARSQSSYGDAPPTELREGGEVDVPTERPGRSALAAAVDEAVDRKTKQVIDDMRIKADKKPEMRVFAKALELTPGQQEAAERVVLEGQRETYAILETPTQDGRNLMTELVDLAAKGIAEPGKDHGWGKWLGRIMTEKVPGTDQTYAERLETIKQGVQAEFKRTWTPKQYKEFEEWGVNPTEIKGVPGSPEIELEKRIVQRARMLGAEIPDELEDE